MTLNVRNNRYGGASDFELVQRLVSAPGSRQAKAWAAAIIWFDLGGAVPAAASAREHNPLWRLASLYRHTELRGENELLRLLLAAGMTKKYAVERCRRKVMDLEFYRLGQKIYAGKIGGQRKNAPHRRRLTVSGGDKN
jgi:hypothetical protein